MPSPITADCLADIAGLGHGFFTRDGGVSDGLYASLNCGIGSKDERQRVLENRNRAARHLGAASGSLITAHQVHSAEAVVVTEPWSMTEGARPQVDGLVTRVPRIALGALGADCAPVLFADPEARVIGACHSGWKGALSGIVEATVAAMLTIGARRNRIRAVLGPCISQSAYEVGPEFEARFLEVSPDHACFFRRPSAGARPHFDLPGFVLDRLARAGLDTVESQHVCTYPEENRLFSYRRATHRGEPVYGSQVSAIVLL